VKPTCSRNVSSITVESESDSNSNSVSVFVSNSPFNSSHHPTTSRGNKTTAITMASTQSGSDKNNHSSASTGSESLTFGNQKHLPRLPIPTLEETMEKFLKHLEALEAEADPEVRWETKQAIREFLKGGSDGDKDDGDKDDSDGDGESSSKLRRITGPMLQKLLLDYDRSGQANGSIGSYVEEFWSEAYLAPDSSVVLNLNPYFLLEESPDPKLAGNQIPRAANLCFASVKMASQLRNETLKPDTFRGKALCMDQFRALFGASRVPQLKSSDTIAVYNESNHVAVMCCNQLYYFQALWPNGDVAVDEGDLVDILEAIWANAHGTETAPAKASASANIATATAAPSTKTAQGTGTGTPTCRDHYTESVSALGVLTSLDRTQWAQAREEIIRHAPTTNTESFAIVDSALFVLVLDDCSPRTKHEAAANMLHGSYELAEHHPEDSAYNAIEYQVGSCTNRWYDKLQIIVTSDGGAGINFEHSAIDGHTALRFVSDIYADTVIAFAQSITKLVHAHQGLVPSVITANVRRAAVTLDQKGRPTLDVFPKKICFELSESIQRKIYFAETALGDQILASDTHILEFKDYGKRFITFNKLSPDSYVQMSMMLAYYRLYGKIVCAYEPVMTKGFYHGRTEAMRPATIEAKELCEIFCNPSSTPQEKLAALRRATQAHSQLVKECAQGKGVDRHLYALKCIAEKHELPVPEFFRSEAWRKLNHTILSTSNCGNPSLALFGFGPVVPDGYGIGYIIKDSHLHYAICSKHRQTTRYALTLEGVLREMASLLEPISQTKVYDPKGRPSLRALSAGNDVSCQSFQDIWGESTFETIKEAEKPKVILESDRWSPEGQPPSNQQFQTSELTLDLGEPLINNQKSSSIRTLNSEAESSGVRSCDGDDDDDHYDDDDDDFPPEPVPVRLNDDNNNGRNPFGNDTKTPVTTNKPSLGSRIAMRTHKRRGSNDQMPVRPDRRGSMNRFGIGPAELAELMRSEDRDSSGKS